MSTALARKSSLSIRNALKEPLKDIHKRLCEYPDYKKRSYYQRKSKIEDRQELSEEEKIEIDAFMDNMFPEEGNERLCAKDEWTVDVTKLKDQKDRLLEK